MKITVSYNRKSFFGGYELAEDTTYNGTIERLKKCFTALKKDNDFVVHIDSKYSVFWNTLSEYESGVLTLRINLGDWRSYDEKKIAYNIARKEIINEYESKADAA